MKILKKSLALIGTEAGATFVCFFVTVPLSVIIRNMTALTVVTFLIFMGTLYSLGWKAGKRDSKNVGDCFPDIKGTFFAAGIAGAFTLILLLIRISVYNINPYQWLPIGEGGELILTKSYPLLTVDVIYKLWNYYFISFLNEEVFITYLLPAFFPIIIYPLGYFVGLKRFSIIDKYMPKIVYKNNKPRS